MSDPAASRFDRRRLLAAGAGFGITFPLVLGYSSLQARRADAPRAIALGAGKNLSVLVTAGPARLLVATGTDTTDFGNALASALPFGLRRIDVVLLAGRDKSAIVAAHAARTLNHRRVAIVDPTLSIDELGPPSDQRFDVVTDPRRYQLPQDVTVTVETATGNEGTGWTAIIARGDTRVVVMPDDESSALFPSFEPTSALIATGDLSSDSIATTRAAAIVVNADSATDVTVQDEALARSISDLAVLRVFGGEAKSLEFVDDGLRLHADARLTSSPDSFS